MISKDELLQQKANLEGMIKTLQLNKNKVLEFVIKIRKNISDNSKRASVSNNKELDSMLAKGLEIIAALEDELKLCDESRKNIDKAVVNIDSQNADNRSLGMSR